MNVPPPSGVKTSYWLPSGSVRIGGIAPAGLRGSGVGSTAVDDRRTVMSSVTVQLTSSVNGALHDSDGAAIVIVKVPSASRRLHSLHRCLSSVFADWGSAAARLRQLRSAGSLADNARQPTDAQAGLLLGHSQGVTTCAAMKSGAAVRACYRDVVNRCRSRCVGPAAFLEQRLRGGTRRRSTDPSRSPVAACRSD